MDDDLSFAYISEHFEPLTRPRPLAAKARIFIVDGHSSHVHQHVVQFAFNYNIHMICLPPYSTHLMQPLDVGYFSLVQKSYQWHLRRWIAANPMDVLKKVGFQSLLTATHNELYTVDVLLAAWKKSGCWPIDQNCGTQAQARGQAAASQTSLTTPPSTVYHAVDTLGRLKHLATEIETRVKVVDPELISIVRDYNQEVMHAVTKYRDIEKWSTTLMKLRSSKTVNSSGPNQAYVGPDSKRG